MKIKSFKSFKIYESEETEFSPQSFTSNQFDEFCDAVHAWTEKTKQPISWCLYSKPRPSTEDGLNKAYTKDLAKRFWDMYVRGDKSFTIVPIIDFSLSDSPSKDGLIGIIHIGDKIESATDNMDRKYDLNKAQELLGGSSPENPMNFPLS